MKFLTIFSSLLCVRSAAASPLGSREVAVRSDDAPDSIAALYNLAASLVTPFPIHDSCNITLRRQLERALNETIELAFHAKQHLLLQGQDSSFVRKYFGNSSTATAIGWYERVVSANKTAMLFRCDDPDRNCATQEGWAGHWRGSNATQETVICPLSFQRRRYLDSVCGLGYTVAESPLNTYWATDLLHRIFHVPQLSEGVVDHFAEDYEDVLTLAKTDSAKSSIDSDTLQYFAIDVYAHDVAAPGVGCSGSQDTVPAAPSTTLTQPASPTTSADTSCHTHSDGVLHCD
ncbi:zincin [Coniochaeta ligniaria NRRL 30616]|uniref:Zincin n=1 Tax=Coniochaeta ligniaria NRRL 30616 TaxID=1408157 RepID=A0A1J7IQ38_9PEZI|nr:zincin [Coniochaeta ligniaria NRRL 30616]